MPPSVTMNSQPEKKRGFVNRIYEQKRRARINGMLDKLASLLPDFDKENPWAKKVILFNAINFVKELKETNENQSQKVEHYISSLLEEIKNLKQIILGSTEMKYLDRDIYSNSSAEIRQALVEISCKNYHLLQGNGENTLQVNQLIKVSNLVTQDAYGDHDYAKLSEANKGHLKEAIQTAPPSVDNNLRIPATPDPGGTQAALSPEKKFIPAQQLITGQSALQVISSQPVVQAASNPSCTQVVSSQPNLQVVSSLPGSQVTSARPVLQVAHVGRLPPPPGKMLISKLPKGRALAPALTVANQSGIITLTSNPIILQGTSGGGSKYVQILPNSAKAGGRLLAPRSSQVLHVLPVPPVMQGSIPIAPASKTTTEFAGGKKRRQLASKVENRDKKQKIQHGQNQSVGSMSSAASSESSHPASGIYTTSVTTSTADPLPDTLSTAATVDRQIAASSNESDAMESGANQPQMKSSEPNSIPSQADEGNSLMDLENEIPTDNNSTIPTLNTGLREVENLVTLEPNLRAVDNNFASLNSSMGEVDKSIREMDNNLATLGAADKLEPSMEIEIVEETIQEDVELQLAGKKDNRTAEKSSELTGAPHQTDEAAMTAEPDKADDDGGGDNKTRVNPGAHNQVAARDNSRKGTISRPELEGVSSGSGNPETRLAKKKTKSIYSIPALCQISVNIGGDRPDIANSPGVVSWNSTDTISPCTTPIPTSGAENNSGGGDTCGKPMEASLQLDLAPSHEDPVIEELKTIRPEDVSILPQVELSGSGDAEDGEAALVSREHHPSTVVESHDNSFSNDDQLMTGDVVHGVDSIQGKEASHAVTDANFIQQQFSQALEDLNEIDTKIESIKLKDDVRQAKTADISRSEHIASSSFANVVDERNGASGQINPDPSKPGSLPGNPSKIVQVSPERVQSFGQQPLARKPTNQNKAEESKMAASARKQHSDLEKKSPMKTTGLERKVNHESPSASKSPGRAINTSVYSQTMAREELSSVFKQDNQDNERNVGRGLTDIRNQDYKDGKSECHGQRANIKDGTPNKEDHGREDTQKQGYAQQDQSKPAQLAANAPGTEKNPPNTPTNMGRLAGNVAAKMTKESTSSSAVDVEVKSSNELSQTGNKIKETKLATGVASGSSTSQEANSGGVQSGYQLFNASYQVNERKPIPEFDNRMQAYKTYPTNTGDQYRGQSLTSRVTSGPEPHRYPPPPASTDARQDTAYSGQHGSQQSGISPKVSQSVGGSVTASSARSEVVRSNSGGLLGPTGPQAINQQQLYLLPSSSSGMAGLPSVSTSLAGSLHSTPAGPSSSVGGGSSSSTSAPPSGSGMTASPSAAGPPSSGAGSSTMPPTSASFSVNQLVSRKSSSKKLTAYAADHQYSQGHGYQIAGGHKATGSAGRHVGHQTTSRHNEQAKEKQNSEREEYRKSKGGSNRRNRSGTRSNYSAESLITSQMPDVQGLDYHSKDEKGKTGYSPSKSSRGASGTLSRVHNAGPPPPSSWTATMDMNQPAFGSCLPFSSLSPSPGLFQTHHHGSGAGGPDAGLMGFEQLSGMSFATSTTPPSLDSLGLMNPAVRPDYHQQQLPSQQLHQHQQGQLLQNPQQQQKSAATGASSSSRQSSSSSSVGQHQHQNSSHGGSTHLAHHPQQHQHHQHQIQQQPAQQQQQLQQHQQHHPQHQQQLQQQDQQHISCQQGISTVNRNPSVVLGANSDWSVNSLTNSSALLMDNTNNFLTGLPAQPDDVAFVANFVSPMGHHHAAAPPAPPHHSNQSHHQHHHHQTAAHHHHHLGTHHPHQPPAPHHHQFYPGQPSGVSGSTSSLPPISLPTTASGGALSAAPLMAPISSGGGSSVTASPASASAAVSRLFTTSSSSGHTVTTASSTASSVSVYSAYSINQPGSGPVYHHPHHALDKATYSATPTSSTNTAVSHHNQRMDYAKNSSVSSSSGAGGSSSSVSSSTAVSNLSDMVTTVALSSISPVVGVPSSLSSGVGAPPHHLHHHHHQSPLSSSVTNFNLSTLFPEINIHPSTVGGLVNCPPPAAPPSHSIGGGKSTSAGSAAGAIGPAPPGGGTSGHLPSEFLQHHSSSRSGQLPSSASGHLSSTDILPHSLAILAPTSHQMMPPSFSVAPGLSTSNVMPGFSFTNIGDQP